MTTILVTGGAGYIGSHTCKALAAQGYTPVVFDNLSEGHRDFVRWGELIEGDVRDTARLQQVLIEKFPAAVIHFAASAYVGVSIEQPQAYYENNIIGSLSLLTAMRAAGCRNIVFSSSCAVYGKVDSLPIKPNQATMPINPYGRSKLAVEQVLADCQAAYGLNSVSLRYFNAAGADPDCEIGEWHIPETHLIPNVIYAALDNSQPLQLFGNDYHTPDGTCVRDYVHVSDLAAAHVLAVEYLSGNQGG
ncbi:MAG: UDP-glucose 4-epimerase GalE, partial [Gammaproteobacteria bacterium]|nr:UDP-glucose 4-epimerase GalE [Gammaproteobacteria bacterium]